MLLLSLMKSLEIPIINTRYGHDFSESLRERDLSGRVGLRVFSRDRLDTLLVLGTDRGVDSDREGARLFREEEMAIQKLGHLAVTFVSPYSLDQKAWPAVLSRFNHAVAVYNLEGLECIDHNNWNGLHKFSIPARQALRAVVIGSEDPLVHANEIRSVRPDITDESLRLLGSPLQ